MSPRDVYKGWRISYSAGTWYAHRYGVRLNAGTAPALRTMIDTRPPHWGADWPDVQNGMRGRLL